MSPVVATPQIAPELIWRILDNGRVLVSPYVGEVYVLRPMDSVIWQLLVEERPLTEIEGVLSRTLNVSLEQAQSHLRAFLLGLTRQGILVWPSS
jgi:hypothetical protein